MRPRNKPTDEALFRKQYLATLKLQSEINEVNLRANQMYVKTGMPPNTPLDTRTTTERVADVVKLRADLIMALKEIADGVNSQGIVASLNADQLLFVSQHMPEIVSILKPKYKYGIPADIFTQSFLPTYMNDEFRRRTIIANLPQNIFDANEIPPPPPDEIPPQEGPVPQGGPIFGPEPGPPPPGGEYDVGSATEPVDVHDEYPGIAEEEDIYFQKLIETAPLDVRAKAYDTERGRDVLAEFKDNYDGSAGFERVGLDTLRTAVEQMMELYIAPFTARQDKFGPRGTTKASYLIRLANMNRYLVNMYNRVIKENPIRKPRAGWGLYPSGGRLASRPVEAKRKVVGRGIGEAMKWVSLGKYKIDSHKLDNGIMALRTQSGAIVAKYPTQRLSSAVVPIIEAAVENRQPTFDVLSSLSAEDRSFVKKLSKNAGIFQHIGSGLPSNPKDDEDIKEFEIMRGEILAGNDNTTLVKNFKTQIMRLMSRDLLPKSEGKELLLEMAALGH